MSTQLPLTLRWPAQQRFASFVAGDNGAAVDLLQRAAAEPDALWVFACGPRGSGKTHLLVAACAAAAELGRSAQYLSLRKLAKKMGSGSFSPLADAPSRSGRAENEPDPIFSLRALGGSELLALDDVDAIAGNAEIEHALFDLYNRCKVEKSTLLFAAAAPPAQLGLGLRDLVSRLSACAQAPLRPLDDTARREALKQRAQARGLLLDDGVIDWLFVHAERDLGSLAGWLERIDRASLAAKRRVTVPFLRQLLEEQSEEKKNG